GEGPRQQVAGRRHVQVGQERAQTVDARRDESGGLALGPSLQLVETTRRSLVVRLRREAVDGVEREHDRLSGAERRDDVLHRRASTTRGIPARSGVTLTSVYPSDVSAADTPSAWHIPTSSTRKRACAICASRS